MKKLTSLFKTTVLLFWGLCAIAGLSSCENFLKGADVKAQLEYEIAYANAKDCKVYLSQDSGYGSFLAGGQLNCKVGYESQVQFTLKNQSYIFKGLRAVSTTDKTVSRNDCVEFKTIQSDDEKGVYKLSVKILKAAADILIEPVCHEFPSVASYSPQYSSNGVVSNSVIQCDFNVELDPLPQGSVSIFCGSENITSLYKEPELSEDKKAIIIKPVSSEISAFIKNRGVGFVEITVSLSPAITSTQDREVYNLIQNGKSSFQLRLNPVIDNNAPAFIPDSFKATASRQAMENGDYYDLSYKWDDQGEITNKAIDSVFFSFDVYENESSIAYIKIREQAVASKGYIPTIGDNAKEFKSNSDPQDTTVAYPFKDFTYTENDSVYSYDFEYEINNKRQMFIRLELTAYDEAGHATETKQLDFCKYNIEKDNVYFYVSKEVPQANEATEEATIRDHYIKNADGSSDAEFDMGFYLETVNDSFFANAIDDYKFEYALSKTKEGLENAAFVPLQVAFTGSRKLKIFNDNTEKDFSTARITINVPDVSTDTYLNVRATDKYGFVTENNELVIPGEAVPLYYLLYKYYPGGSYDAYSLQDFFEYSSVDNINRVFYLYKKNKDGAGYFLGENGKNGDTRCNFSVKKYGYTYASNFDYSDHFYTENAYKFKLGTYEYSISGPTTRLENTGFLRINTIYSSEGPEVAPKFSYEMKENNTQIECTFDFTNICNNSKYKDISKIFINCYDFTAYLDVSSGNTKIIKRLPASLFEGGSVSYEMWVISNKGIWRSSSSDDAYSVSLGDEDRQKIQKGDTTPPKISFGTKAELTKSFFFKDENYDWTSSSKVKVQYASDSYEAELLLPVIELTHNDGYSVDVPVRQIPVGEYCDITLTVSDKYGNVSQATQEHVNVRKDFTYDFDPDFNFTGKKKYKFRVANDELKSKESLAGQYVYLNNLPYEIQGEDYDIDVFYLDSTSGKAEWKKYAGPVHAGGGASDDDYIIDQIAYGAFLKLNTVKFYRINYTNSIYDYQDSAPKYMRAGNPVFVAVKDILELTNGVQVYSSDNVLIHTLYGPFDYGDNIDDWEYHCEHTELNLVYETADHRQTPYYYTIPASKVPSGMYYTTIIYFADNTALKTKVRYAQ